ncbi:hypothetical protein ERO13_D11G227200v2 [Gossypium hirsutum]|uniref:Uncharacterized protein isoform X1 n=4 Tax=Gossypium TaxID=3633 RepID=A0A1U8KV67_GOSHI|nr:uncharacterized protein LOC105785377 [Gossypium raimondii]XP_016706362.1 uncharacterized protein LOC107921024 isoform X1 [Gossypium hirsutum]KAG4121766.1 hypothetical protein ERO13_D11G227200v2 [Gossypium hirsutum]KJB14930.1 hypothetical protein B456_002G149700 [Gossypium raimondii]TYI57008.1 hypothetical protein E1A91_D11G250700v1 [Gossypium mustelinum]
MSKKRKSDATRLDEVDRSMYTTFCSAANSLSQLYSQAMNHQRLSFQAGERHALEKLFQWILRQQEEGSRVTTTDIVSYLQNEVDFGAEESPMSPRLSFQLQQHPQTATQLNTSSAPFSSTPISAAKNSVFSNALSSPVRRSLQHYHSVQVGYHSNNVLSSANGSRNTETNYCHQQIREVNSPSPNDCMDMHADSPAGDFLL